ncbi:MAG: DUF1643 domain-containing protein [Chloroflexota bacterium]|nr:DUF1643 domain-containing protein [Chloroflexota bacterium]
MEKGALFSPCRSYRYALWRVWDDARPFVLFVCLNPSTADERRNDPTVRRCVGFARAWRYGGVYVANLFAYRATDPQVLKCAPHPVGPESDRWLKELAEGAEIVVAAWGNHGTLMNRAQEVLSWLPKAHYLVMTKGGQPGHPLYLRKDCQPQPFPNALVRE